MAIAYDTSVTLNAGADATTTTNMTIAATSNSYLFVLSTSYASAISFDGLPLTKLTTNILTGNSGFSYVPNTSVWGRANPSTGTKVLSVTTVGGQEAIIAACYNGVDPVQAEAYVTNQTNGNNVTQQTDSITTVTNNAWIVTFINGGGNLGRNFTAGAGTTLRQTIANGTNNLAAGILDSGGAKTPVSAYTLVTNWSSSQGWFNSIIYSIKPYLTASFSGPASGNVNAASTNFTVTPDVAINGTITITPTGTGSSGLSPTVLTFSNSAVAQTFTITPLTSGTITLTMTNGVGLNNPAVLTYTANAVAPNAPVIGTATPGNTTTSVAFSTPSSDGGSTITQYRAISTPGSFVNTGASSPIVVSGLSNGTPYTFTVRATNAIGNSSESSASNSATPYVAATSFTFTGPSSGNVRSASTNFTATPNNVYYGTITLTPSGVGSTGLVPVILTWNGTSTATTFTITPTASGAITLTPTNSNGLANASNLVYTAAAVVPLAPQMGLAESSLSSARVTVSAPTNDGGATITLYTVTSSPGGLTATSLSAGTITVLGLTNGTSYTFTAKATNSVGQSAASSASNAVIPSASSTSFTNSGPKFNIDRGVGNLITF
jgi:hypothetical protein